MNHNIYGVVFKNGGKVYYFNGLDLKCPKNVTVIVETEKGLQFGKVVSSITPNDLDLDIASLKQIIRISTKEDYDQHLKNLREADKAFKKAKEFIQELGLEMTLLDASFTFDKKQLLFNFIADERVDFRELAKKLATIYRTRIELRQIGARDKAREIGGLGLCGRPLCCSTFLNRIEAVSMNMAKNQNIALNPSKINGSCGRLLCCLTYEDEEYSRCQRGLPSVGQTVKTKFGSGQVISVDVLSRKYKVDINGDVKEISMEKSDDKSNQ